MKTYLPLALGNGPTDVVGQVDVADALFGLMVDDPQQGRKPCQWNQKLADIALARVKNMARNGWVGHVYPRGHGPNWWVDKEGYRLPDFYLAEPELNYIESLQYGGGPDVDVDLVWQRWMDSPTHKTHILGLTPFFASQTQVGIASYFLQDSIAGIYHCILSAPPEVTA